MYVIKEAVRSWILPRSQRQLIPLLEHYLTRYLPFERNASPHTIAAYGDTFRLLLQFLRRTRGQHETALTIDDVSAPAILEFLEDLERERNYRVCSRNARLTAIRSFFRMVEELHGGQAAATGVFQIPVKPTGERTVRHLTPEEMEAVIAAPDRSQWSGRRDHALLLTMYNSGARLSEIITLRHDQARFGAASVLRLRGLRTGERIVPLWHRTSRILQRWFAEVARDGTDIAFPSARGGRLSGDGVNYLLQLAVRRASGRCASLAGKRVTPHVIRHYAGFRTIPGDVNADRWDAHECWTRSISLTSPAGIVLVTGC
jgi:site-specific recombinase XerD